MEWVKRWGYELAASPISPGVYRLKAGGFYVRFRIKNRSGKRTQFSKVLPSANLKEALKWKLDAEVGARDLVEGAVNKNQLWSKYATDLLQRKKDTGEIKSAAGYEKWEHIIRLHLEPSFGLIPCHDLKRVDIERWREAVAKRISNGELSPNTANTWFNILRAICFRMRDELELPRNPIAGVQEFDASEYETYTDEDPNTLTTPQAILFIEKMKEMFPQHFAMTFFGFCTGLRPSHMRPIRRKGADADVNWEEGFVRVRRSNSRGETVMNTTKTKRRQKIYFPQGVMSVLREHCMRFENSQMQASDLLFPSTTGGFRSRSCLDKPFAAVSKAIGLPFTLTPRGMRRTFIDLARTTHMNGLVTRRISGHATESMQDRYSTAQIDEMRSGIAAIDRLVRGGMGGNRGGK